MEVPSPSNCWLHMTPSKSGHSKPLHDITHNKWHHSLQKKKRIPWAAERLARRLFPVKMALTLWAQFSWLPSSDTPQRGSDIRLRVALSSSPVMGSLDNHWKLLQRDKSCRTPSDKMISHGSHSNLVNGPQFLFWSSQEEGAKEMVSISSH